MAEDRLAAASSMLSDPELPPADVPTTPVGGSDTRFRTEPTLGLLESVRQVRGWVREDMQMLSPYAMEAKQLLSSKGKELLGAATQASAAASQTLKATAAEAGLDWRAYLGGDDGGAALCGACAAPFSHGAALAPELRRFQQHFDRTAEDVAALRLASDQVRVRARARARAGLELGLVKPHPHPYPHPHPNPQPDPDPNPHPDPHPIPNPGPDPNPSPSPSPSPSPDILSP